MLKGDLVKFNSSSSEMYPYDVPETDEHGTVKFITINKPMQLALGVDLAMAMVEFKEYNRLIYIEHLSLISKGTKGSELDESEEISYNSEIN